MADKLTKIYHDGKDAKGPPEELRALRNKLHKRTQRIIQKWDGNPITQKFITKLKNALPDLFLYVTRSNVPGTNNPAELCLREIVVHRKIRGTIRADDTMEWMANIFTCITTWKNKGPDYLSEVASYI